jgi:hypothetical protein
MRASGRDWKRVLDNPRCSRDRREMTVGEALKNARIPGKSRSAHH